MEEPRDGKETFHATQMVGFIVHSMKRQINVKFQLRKINRSQWPQN